MHRSRMYGLFVDVPHNEGDRAVAFWAAALGASPARGYPGDPYTALRGAVDGPVKVEVQRVGDAPRYHVDIESDDVDAEVARLVGLGATRVAARSGWVVLQAPGGHLLCVVPVQSRGATFTKYATTWHD